MNEKGYTGELLNELNGKMGISTPHHSVPIMKLIRQHKPKSKDELVQLIANHAKEKCPCGIISKGTVEQFGKNLFNAQKKIWGHEKFSLQTCIQWEYDLFVTQSLKGNLMEQQALLKLQQSQLPFSVEEAEGYLDEELRIDLILKLESKIYGGIQVKPETHFKIYAKM
ncbi:MAG: MjaI family restriction endonuclease [Chitinophagaceae bacterium]